MTAPVSVVLAVIGLIVSARTHLNAVLFGQHFSISVLGLLFTLLLLAMLALILHLIRVLATEFRKQPEPVIKTVRWERI
jgi:Na+-transporting methylmalonyl-CoA/oxaloacetate decarboxylase gamma subunit